MDEELKYIIIVAIIIFVGILGSWAYGHYTYGECHIYNGGSDFGFQGGEIIGGSYVYKNISLENCNRIENEWAYRTSFYKEKSK